MAMHSRMPNFARVVRCDAADLTVADHDRIERFITVYSLFDRKTLDATLDAATYVWLCLDTKGRIVGTTAVRRVQLAAGVGGHGGAPIVVYTSVVAVNPAYRRLGLPARMGLYTYFHERRRAPFTPLYWLAEAVSPSGYLLIARNLVEFWPRPGVPTPAHAESIIRATLSAVGVTRTERRSEGQFLVNEDYPVIEREQAPDRWQMTDPDVGFFLRTNPDYWAGSALVCLAPLNAIAVGKAVAGVALKVFRRKLARRKPA
ncbi:MAG: hypothetical protein P3A28_05775 [Gemmatimonadota bacterium]|nr:hypothetical protein [Gemmatimonadota bacterium]